MPKPDLIIFDCDGVLVDSEIVAARVGSELLREAGHEITPEELAQQYAGLTFRDILIKIEKDAQILFKATMIEECEALVDKRLRAEVKAIPGTAEAVQSLGIPHCICSNSSTQRIEAMLTRTRLLPLFEGVIYSSLETPTKLPKPAPDVFLHAAEEKGAEPKTTFVIEDSVHGITGARAAGMRVIGFTGASHTHPLHADMLMEAGAETTISRMADLNKTIEALSSFTADI
ncbi:HAD family hydrolase [Nitratireductor basaltis]|uniref:HAD-superfamily hydrolase, subfamily IA, variant 3 n=1 Tax=Nitratireductor basaltis TaxID=472175 RepID=A0A084UCQ1_9HYPH|nr:HAD family phosphatase [Nitratireductor basaltis]KFB10737.1 HAD-superfamily hydrolase, subfamily IA, variant 3 [Nitratireductor basaltis]